MGLLGYASSVNAQTTPNLGPWVLVNTVNPGSFAPGYLVRDMKTVSPTVAWAVAEENTPAGVSNAFFVTNEATGTQFDFGAINAANGAQNFQTGNISPVGVAGTPAAATTAVAATYPAGAGGEILRTTNAGISWTKVTTASQFIGNLGGFCNFVHMFDALEGVSLGDPTNGSFEILRTTDGGVTWTRLPAASSPAPLTDEYGLARSFFARGNTIWAGMGSSNDANRVRIFKSTNRGLTWTASAVTTLLGSTSRLAFKDDLNGIAYNVKVVAGAVSEVNVIRTSDGGATWSPITPINTATGSFFRYDIDAVNGRYYSVGVRYPNATPAVAADFGTSSSTDGINWTNINTSQGFFAFDLIANGTTNAQGYAGAATDATGSGGIYKAASVITATKDAALQSTLSVYPNPSATGAFTVDLGSTLQAGAQLTVVDALGRQVKAQTLNATAIGSKKLNLDLSSEKSGVYTLQIRTAAGIATQKLVVE
ncbi:hypothetical protein GCM10022407_03750 [Hymenobacter antarcticus]|uniref:Secretion system C-terminal sorting domain-containing protein n=2 Tax=Hymenobacter antarcticus TaxID=486270 RepID=A0ABP7P691_9BACT